MLEIILSWPGHFPAHYNADAWNSSLSEELRERERDIPSLRKFSNQRIGDIDVCRLSAGW